ncbi:MAG: HAD-IIA family hydrolase [Acidimicrobiales bacterium]
MAWVLDLDGVVWRGSRPIPGSAEAVELLRRSGAEVLFLTNNSSQRLGAYVAKLAKQGIEASPSDVVSSAGVAARLVRSGERVVVCAGEGVLEALDDRGATAVDEGPADAVIVGWHREFDFDRLRRATSAVLGGARLIGTNDDATYPTEDGLLPGAGAILAAVSFASGTKPVVAGKPYQPVVDLLLERVGPPELVVGDRPSTDGLLAQRLGVPFALVRSGVTPAGESPQGVSPAVDADDLAAVVKAVLDR